MQRTQAGAPAKWFLAVCWATVLTEVFLWPTVASLLRSWIVTVGPSEQILGTWLFGVVPGALVFLLAYTFLWLRGDRNQAERRESLVYAFWATNGVLLILTLVTVFTGSGQ